MSKYRGLSPILRHGLESFEHGVFHFLDDTELGRKFSLLHIDHSVELILKEKVQRIGESIFRRDGKTISVHEAYSILSSKHISIPEKPRLEDLHDFRNIVQHKGLTPDQHTADFYVKEAYRFVRRFLHDELGLELDSYIPRPHLRVMEGAERGELKNRLLEAEAVFASGAYEMAIISAFTALEIAVRNKVGYEKPSPLVSLVRRFLDEGKVDTAVWNKFKHVTRIRNKAAHTGGGISKEQAREALDYLIDVIDALPH